MEDLPGQHGPMYLWPEIKLVEGAIGCLGSLDKFAKCHVATNAKDSTASEIRKAFARGKLNHYIEEIFCANSIGHKKPSSEYFDFIQSKLGAPKSKIVVVGDSLEKDVYGALKQGFNAIWFNRDGNEVPAGIKAIRALNEILPAD